MSGQSRLIRWDNVIGQSRAGLTKTIFGSEWDIFYTNNNFRFHFSKHISMTAISTTILDIGQTIFPLQILERIWLQKYETGN